MADLLIKKPDISVNEFRSSIPVLADIADDVLQWIIDHSNIVDTEPQQIFFKTGEKVEHMHFILEGSYDFYLDQNGKEIYAKTFEQGEVAGLLPFSRMKSSPGNNYANTRSRSLALHKKYFQELEQRSPVLMERLVAILTDRSRHFTTFSQQQEKMNALGKLAAGLAHELNNPSAAIVRSAKSLNKSLTDLPKLTEGLIVKKVSCKDFDKIVNQISSKSQFLNLTFNEKNEHEEELIKWFEANKIGNGWRLAYTFADAGITSRDLEKVLKKCDADQVESVLHWLELYLQFHILSKEIEFASVHISELVTAIKKHSHLDRTQELLPADIHEGINNTLIILQHKIFKKNINLVKSFDIHLPKVPAYVGELNQVWLNIVDNAIDASETDGEIVISTYQKGIFGYVAIHDNGKGIPPELQTRIFDPFFTTKSVGEGTGLGLDVAKRIVKRHKGKISFKSKPGDTTFIIQLPLQK